MARTPDIGETRGEYLRVRLAPSEAQYLDMVRGDRSRSDFVRDQIALASMTKPCPHPHEAGHGHG